MERYKCTEAIGFIKHAFILSFYYLFKAADQDEDGNLIYDLDSEKGKMFYYESVRESISLGGDTDTNACIVGGIVGTYVGIKNISEDLIKTYFTYDNKTADFDGGKGRLRPEWLNMGRNTLDSALWMIMMRFRANGNQQKVNKDYDEIKRIPDDQPIKN